MKRQNDGETALQAKLLFTEDCSRFKSHHRHSFSDVCVPCCGFRGSFCCFELIPSTPSPEQAALRARLLTAFAESDSVIISTRDGRWAIGYATVTAVLTGDNLPSFQSQAELPSLSDAVSSDPRVWLFVSSSSFTLPYHHSPLHQFFRIDKYKSIDTSLIAVNNLATFAAHIQGLRLHSAFAGHLLFTTRSRFEPEQHTNDLSGAETPERDPHRREAAAHGRVTIARWRRC